MVASQKNARGVVSPDAENNRNAKGCEVCKKEFQPKRCTARFCSKRCQQSAHRKTPAGQAAAHHQGERMKVRRAFRKSQRFARLNRDRALVFDGRFSGPVVPGVPSLGEMKLPSYAEASRG